MYLFLCGCWVGMRKVVSITLSRINQHTNLICQLASKSIMIQPQLITWEVIQRILKPHLCKAQPALEENVGIIHSTNVGFISEAWGLWYVINRIIKFTLFITEFLLFNFEIKVDCRKMGDVNFTAVLLVTAQGGWVYEVQKTFWRQTVFRRREGEAAFGLFRLGLHCTFENSAVFRFPMGCDGEQESQGYRWEIKPQVYFAQLCKLPAERARLKGWRGAETHIQNCASPDLPASGASAFPILTHAPCGLYMAL